MYVRPTFALIVAVSLLGHAATTQAQRTRGPAQHSGSLVSLNRAQPGTVSTDGMVQPDSVVEPLVDFQQPVGGDVIIAEDPTLGNPNFFDFGIPRPWLGVVGARGTSIVDDFGELIVNEQTQQFFGTNQEDTRTGAGFFLQADVQLTEIITFTAATDVEFFGQEDSLGVGNGAHAVGSFQINVDPMLENLFYGVSVDLYSQPMIDPLDTDDFHSVITGILRGGAGISTAVGDLIIRGGGRFARDYDTSFTNVTLPPTSAVAVGFTTKHVEGGVKTQVGPAYLGLFGGWRSDPDERSYFYGTCNVPISQLPFSPAFVGDFYIDDPHNLSAMCGVAFTYDAGIRPYGVRKVFEPMSVSYANRMQFREVSLLPADQQ